MSDRSDRPASVRRYVFYNEHRPSRAWMPTLEMINDRFSQNLQTALMQHLGPGVEVTSPIAIQLISHRELIERLAIPSYLALVNFKPLPGTILVVVDAQLVSGIVEGRFGGNGRFPVTISNRGFSPFEQKSTRRVVQTTLGQLALAWRSIGNFEPEIARHEINPQFAAIANASELVIVSSFGVRVGQGGGKLTVGMPYAMLEPMHERLVAGPVREGVDCDPRWRKSLTVSVGRSTMTLKVELAKIEVTLRDLLELQVGNVFEIDRPERVMVEASGLPLFRGRWGKYGRRIAVRIEERLLSTPEVRIPRPPEERMAGVDDER
jgi:flagellar motor switch protein FliM